MSKKYKGKLCVYCGVAQSSAGDHVFAREFFLVPDRGSLPKVPACADCNCTKSELEHYAVSVLPFGGRHSGAAESLETMVPKRLARNAPLSRMLTQNRGRAWGREDTGLVVPLMTLPVDSERLNQLFAFIAKGLLWHHWQTRLSDADSVSVTMLAGERLFDEHFLRVPVAGSVAEDLGNGTVQYEGVQGVDCPRVSVWRLRVFGGVRLGDSDISDGESSVVGLVTGPRAAVDGSLALEPRATTVRDASTLHRGVMHDD